MTRAWRHPWRPGPAAAALALFIVLALAAAAACWSSRPALLARADKARAALAALGPAGPPAPAADADADLRVRLDRLRALGAHPRDEATRLLALLERGLPPGGRLRELQWDPAMPEDQLVLEWRGQADTGALAELLKASGAYAHIALEQEAGPRGSQRSVLRLRR